RSSAGVSASATTVTVAPAARQRSTLRSAAGSPPTTTHGRPSKRRKTAWVRIPKMLPDASGPRNTGPARTAARSGATRDLQDLAGADVVALDAVGGPQARDADLVALCDLAERVAAADSMRGRRSTPARATRRDRRRRGTRRDPHDPLLGAELR